MSLLAYNELVKLVDSDIINASYQNVNGSSIDITLASDFYRETRDNTPVNINTAGRKIWEPIKPVGSRIEIAPGELILASTREVFNLPISLSAEYKITSSLARMGLDHTGATWCSPSWHNSTLTLELRNNLKFHPITLYAGMKIGHMIFFSHDKAIEYQGSYNDQRKTTLSNLI